MVILFSIVTGTIYLGVATPTRVSAFGAFRLALVKGKITPASLLRAVHGTCGSQPAQPCGFRSGLDARAGKAADTYPQAAPAGSQ